MKMYQKEKVILHVKRLGFIFIIIGIYAFVGINGVLLFQKSGNIDVLKEVSYSQDSQSISFEILAEEYVFLDISGLDKQQETVHLYFYTDDKRPIYDKDYVLCNGINSLGKFEQNVTSIQYDSESEFALTNVYSAGVDLLKWKDSLIITVSLFVLCFMQYIIVLVKRKYAN